MLLAIRYVLQRPRWFATFGRLQSATPLAPSVSKKRDVTDWNKILKSTVGPESPSRWFNILHKMKREGVAPDERTFTILLAACASQRSFEPGMKALRLFRSSGLTPNVYTNNALLSLYVQCGKHTDAEQLFESLSERSPASWNIMLQAYAVNGTGNVDAMFGLLRRMMAEGIANDRAFAIFISVCTSRDAFELGQAAWALFKSSGLPASTFVSNAVLMLLTKCGRFDEAKQHFQAIPAKTNITWNIMLQAHAEVAVPNLEEMFSLIQQMGLQNTISDRAFVIMLSACRTALSSVSFHIGGADAAAAKEIGTRVIAQLQQSNLKPTGVLDSSILSFYAKCGDLTAAELYYQSHSDTLEAKNAMIQAYATFGKAAEALNVYQTLRNPDSLAAASVLTAFSRSLDAEQALKFFDSLAPDLRQGQPIVILVDCLARSGRFDLALARAQPVLSDRIVCTTLLGACRTRLDVTHALPIAERMIADEPADGTPYVLMMNIYQALGQHDAAEAMRQRRIQNRAHVTPGLSATTIDGVTYTFGPADFSHERGTELKQMCQQMAGDLQAAGFEPDVHWSTTGRTDGEKRAALCLHSERIAIAFNLLVTPPGTPIEIRKNLRVCGDCHSATKALAKIYKRRMLVRDKSRWHEFDVDGTCSCCDRY